MWVQWGGPEYAGALLKRVSIEWRIRKEVGNGQQPSWPGTVQVPRKRPQSGWRSHGWVCGLTEANIVVEPQSNGIIISGAQGGQVAIVVLIRRR